MSGHGHAGSVGRGPVLAAPGLLAPVGGATRFTIRRGVGVAHAISSRLRSPGRGAASGAWGSRVSCLTPDLLALLALALSALLLHWQGLGGGPTYYERDTQLFYLPLAGWVSEQLKQGSYPLWTPALFTGYPLFADGELGLLYAPQVLLLWLLPAPLALVWLRILHVFLAGAFMHLFLRGLRLGPLASLGGALVFAFGSFMTAQMHHENVIRSAVWLPLVLALVDRALRVGDRRRWGWAALAALAFAQAALGLHVQPVLMLALALGAWVLFRALVGPRGWLDARHRSARGRPPAAVDRWLSRDGADAPAGPVRAVDASAPALAGQPRQADVSHAGAVRAAPHRSAPAPLAVRAAPRPFAVRLMSAVGHPAAVLLLAVGLGLALAAAQWVPLAEWALASFRRGGVDYVFASAFSLTPQNLLPTLLFPYFFRLPDNATWWTLWQPWETELYVGVPTLALALVGALLSRRREALFFVLLGLGALLVSLGPSAPGLNLHELLWSVPGFSFLRAPGRFSYLVVFAFAGLAALGLQALADRRGPLVRPLVALAGAGPSVALLAALLALLPAWRGQLQADTPAALRLVQDGYLSARAQFGLDPRLVLDGLLTSLDLATPKTAWGLVLLGLTAAGFVAWLGLGPRRGWLGQALLVSLLALDLLVFAADFHPRAPLADLALQAPPGVPPGARVLVRRTLSLPDYEPNALISAGLRQVDGYSSLPSLRHVDLFGQSQQQPGLMDVWSAPYVVEPRAPVGQREAGGVRFRPDFPLAGGFAGSGSARFQVPPDVGAARAVRLVGSLSYAYDLPTGTLVAEVVATDTAGGRTRLPVRAGLELAERAIDRPSLQGLLRHGKPPGPTALDFEEVSPAGEAYVGHLYLADLPLPAASPLAALEVLPVHPRALVQVFGLGVVPADPALGARSLGFGDRAGLRLVGQTEQALVFEDRLALPRAALWDRASAIARERQPDRTPVQMMAGAGFDPRRNVLIEGDPSLAGVPEAPGALSPDGGARALEVEELGPNRLQVRAEVDRPSYLVLNDFYHRGWQAWVDGAPARVFIANAAFRAVALEPGRHVVEMRFQPLSHVAGALLTLAALALTLALVAWSVRWRRPGY